MPAVRLGNPGIVGGISVSPATDSTCRTGTGRRMKGVASLAGWCCAFPEGALPVTHRRQSQCSSITFAAVSGAQQQELSEQPVSSPRLQAQVTDATNAETVQNSAAAPIVIHFFFNRFVSIVKYPAPADPSKDVQFNESRLRNQTGRPDPVCNLPETGCSQNETGPFRKTVERLQPEPAGPGLHLHEQQTSANGSIRTGEGFPAIGESPSHGMLPGPAVIAGSGGESACGCGCLAGWERDRLDKISTFYPWIVRVFVYGFLLEILYIAVANMMLSTGILYTLLNRKPAKHQYEWQSAWTVVPGVIRINQFKMRNRTPRTAWNLAIDEAWMRINLPALVLRSFRVSSIRATGVSAEVFRLKPSLTENPSETPEAVRIPASLDSPESHQDSSRHPRSSRPPRKWHIRLKRIFVDDLTRLDMDGYIWSGHGRVRGTLDMVTRDVLHIPKVKATLSEGTVSFRNDLVAEHLNVSIDQELGPYLPRENRGRKIFNHLAGSAHVDGYISHFGFLNYYLRNIDWLTISGLGEIDADLHFDHGVLRSGSSLGCRFNRIETRMNDWSIAGTGILSGSVSGQKEATDTLMTLNLENISLSHPQRLPEPAHAPGVVIRMSGRNMRFDSPDPGLTASVDLLDSNIPDLSDYNGLLPPESGIEILPASPCALELHLDVERNRASGNLGIKGADAGIRFRDKKFRGDLSLSTFLESGQLSARTIGVKDLHLSLSSIRQAASDYQHPDVWNAAIMIPDSSLTIDRPVSLSSNISFWISDSRLLTRIFQVNRRFWFEDLVEFSEISGDAAIHLTGRAMTIRNAALSCKGTMTDQVGVQPFGVNASCDSFDLKNGFGNLKLAMKIPTSEIHDLGILNSIIPANSGLMLRPGDTGRLAAEISVVGSRGHGRITIGGKNIGLTMLDQRFEGDLDLDIGATTRDIRSGVLDLSGSTIRLSGFRSLDAPSEPGWWSTLDLTGGTMSIGKPVTIHGNLQLKMRDTGPLLNIFQEQSHAVKWLGDILLVKDIHGTGSLRTDASGLHMPDLVLNGENLDIKARLRFSPGSLRGILYARFMGLSMGVDLKNGRRSYRLIHPGRWFESYPWDDGDN